MLQVTFTRMAFMGDHSEMVTEAVEADANMTIDALVEHIKNTRGYPRAINAEDAITIRLTGNTPWPL